MFKAIFFCVDKCKAVLLSFCYVNSQNILSHGKVNVRLGGDAAQKKSCLESVFGNETVADTK